MLLLGGGIGILLEPFAVPSAYAMSLYWLLSALLVHGSHVVQNPLDVGLWLGCAENMLIACGAWAIFRSLITVPPDSLGVSRLVVSISYIIFGVSHFRYLSFTAAMVPQWLPWHTFFALLTGAGHLAAGIALLVGIIPKVAAKLEAGMITSFVLLLHLPAAFHAPASRMQWTMVFIASTMAASAWAIAACVKAGSETAPAETVTTLPESERRWSLFQELDPRAQKVETHEEICEKGMV